MSEARCTVCKRSHRTADPVANNDTYTLTFASGVCDLCVMTLSRAMEGIVELLRDSHGERRERVIDRLVSRLDAVGFPDARMAFRRRIA